MWLPSGERRIATREYLGRGKETEREGKNVLQICKREHENEKGESEAEATTASRGMMASGAVEKNNFPLSVEERRMEGKKTNGTQRHRQADRPTRKSD